MKKTVGATLVGGLLAAGPALAQAPAALIDRALGDQRAMALITDMTTELGPRLAGSPAEARARDWAVARLNGYGLSNVRVQPFTMTYWGRLQEEVQVVGRFSQPLMAAAIGGSPSTPPGGLEAEVVAYASMAAFRAAPPEEARGKIVFVHDRMVRAQDGQGYGVAVEKRRACAPLAAERGAVACLIRSAGTSQRAPHVGQGARASQASIPAAVLANADADQLERLLARGPVRLHLNIRTESRPDAPSGNVIAEIPGSERPDEVVVIGCHLDSWDNSTGALDDATGCGIVTAAALIAREVAGAPKRTVRIVWWGAEEVGLLGAQAYATSVRETAATHVLAGESDSGGNRVYRLDARFGPGAIGDRTAMSRDLARLGVLDGNNEGMGGPDVGPLRQLGVPVIDPQQDVLDYFDIHHTPFDTLDQVDPDAVAQNVAVWSVVLWHSAWNTPDFRRQ